MAARPPPASSAGDWMLTDVLTGISAFAAPPPRHASRRPCQDRRMPRSRASETAAVDETPSLV